jgi:hypothetical protein
MGNKSKGHRASRVAGKKQVIHNNQPIGWNIQVLKIIYPLSWL